MVPDGRGLQSGERGFCRQLSFWHVPEAGVFIRNGKCYSTVLLQTATVAEAPPEEGCGFCHVSVLTCESLRAADAAKRDNRRHLSHIRPEGIFVNVFSIAVMTPVARNCGYQ